MDKPTTYNTNECHNICTCVVPCDAPGNKGCLSKLSGGRILIPKLSVYTELFKIKTKGIYTTRFEAQAEPVLEGQLVC